MASDPQVVYVVVMDRGGLFGMWFDKDRATEAAQATESAVCTIPVIADFRPSAEPRQPLTVAAVTPALAEAMGEIADAAQEAPPCPAP